MARNGPDQRLAQIESIGYFERSFIHFPSAGRPAADGRFSSSTQRFDLAGRRRRGRHVEQSRLFQHDHRHEKKNAASSAVSFTHSVLVESGSLAAAVVSTSTRQLPRTGRRVAAADADGSGGDWHVHQLGMFGGAERGAGVA